MSEYIDPHAEGLPPTIPPPIWIENISCYTPELLHDLRYLDQDSVGVLDMLKAVFIFLTSILALLFNLIFIVVLNSKYFRRQLRLQPRLIFCAMIVNDVIGVILVLIFGIYTATFECWPFGQTWCQMQAFLKGSLSQNASLILMLLAVERYIASVRPFSYNSLCNVKLCILLLLVLCTISTCFYGFIVLNPNSFHFNINGLMICEPYYLSNNYLILASCLFYFPTTMVLMYSYGTIFHSSKAKSKYRNVIFNTLPFLAGQTAAAGIDHFRNERRRNELVSRSSAAISLAFIIAVTPWAIIKVITSVTRTTAPSIIDFGVSWLEASHSLWSPTIFWMLNPKFRSAANRFLIRKILCRPLPVGWNFAEDDVESSGANADAAEAAAKANTEASVREKFWGEILDKSFHHVSDDDGHVELEQPSSNGTTITSCDRHHTPLTRDV